MIDQPKDIGGLEAMKAFREPCSPEDSEPHMEPGYLLGGAEVSFAPDGTPMFDGNQLATEPHQYTSDHEPVVIETPDTAAANEVPPNYLIARSRQVDPLLDERFGDHI